MIVSDVGSTMSMGTADRDARLRNAARQLEGVFLGHLYKAMREAIPEGGLFEGSAGQDVFTEMFDEHMADAMAERLEGSLGDMLYRQLRQRMEQLDHQGGE